MPPGLVPRRFATREELLDAAASASATELGRTPTARDLDERRGTMPSKSLYWHTFGSLANALRDAGFDVAVGEERLERAVSQGAELAREPRPAAAIRRLGGGAPCASETMLTEWQVYRMFDSGRGAWATFQFLIKARLGEQGATVGSDGSVPPLPA